jgi:crotonobetainyl-CoA:carnitine CoA-transferase CaiB-like acyl-CoA transferase
MKFVDVPVSIDGEKAAIRRMPPRLGEHTEEVLLAAGYSHTEIDSLRGEGVIN